MSEQQSDDHRAQWAIVTTGASCGEHDGPCPAGMSGPYNSLREAAHAAKHVGPSHNPHAIPFFPRLAGALLTSQ